MMRIFIKKHNFESFLLIVSLWKVTRADIQMKVKSIHPRGSCHFPSCKLALAARHRKHHFMVSALIKIADPANPTQKESRVDFRVLVFAHV
jgi:hypothetical protein